MMDGNQMNSVAGVLKSYFRKLSEPLFSETYFDQFMNITSKLFLHFMAVFHFVYINQETVLLLMFFLSRKKGPKVFVFSVQLVFLLAFYFADIGENVEFVTKAQQIIQQWSEPHIAVTRYLFGFLSDLSQYR